MPCPISAGHHQAGEDLPGVMHRPREHHRANPAASSRSNASAWDTTPRPSADTVILGWHAVFVTRKVSSPRRGQDLRKALSPQAKVIFTCKRSRLADHRRNPEVSASEQDQSEWQIEWQMALVRATSELVSAGVGSCLSWSADTACGYGT
jgi:hypothetical protein